MLNYQIKVTPNLIVEVIKENNDTEIYLLENNERYILSILETDDNFSSNVLYDDTYIIIYSQKYNHLKNTIKLEAAYNYQTKKIVNLANIKLRRLLEYRFILKQCFDLRVVLSLINNIDLKLLASPEELIRFKEYLTSGNNQINQEEIIAYIIKKYPILKKYANLTSPPYVSDYLKIVEDVGNESLYFHSMPTILLDNLTTKLR